MKDYKSLTCLEIKQILKKHNVSGYSKLCKQELVKLAKKTLNNKKIKKGGALGLVSHDGDGESSRNKEKRETEERIEQNFREANRELNLFLKQTVTPRQESMITMITDDIIKKCLKKNENRMNEQQREDLKLAINDLKDELFKERTEEIATNLIKEIRKKISTLMVNHGFYCMMKLRKEQESQEE
jgi:hypothetical protein